jgi:hypothetical protein
LYQIGFYGAAKMDIMQCAFGIRSIVKQGVHATIMLSITIARKVESMIQQILTLAIDGWLLILEIFAIPAGSAMSVE